MSIKKIGAVLGLTAMGLGLVSTLWGYSADYQKLKNSVTTKADKTSIQKLHNKIDMIILGLCIIDKRTCILKGK